MKERILEVGCGTNPRENTGNNNDVLHVSTDFNYGLLEQLKEKGVGGELVLADARHLPFQTGAFDKVSSHHVIEHVPGCELAVEEMGRVTKPAGDVEIAVPHPVYDTVMAVALLGYFPYWSTENHVNVVTPEKLTTMVEDAGFSVEKVEKRGWWRAIATIRNYLTARINNEPMNGHTQRIVSKRQERLLAKREQFLQAVSTRDQSFSLLNNIIPYETVVNGKKDY